MTITVSFQVRRLRPALREKVRYSPQPTGPSTLKFTDYLEDGEIEATSPYHAWLELREQDRALGVGDVLISEAFGTQICRYAGFEDATWQETSEAAAAAAVSGETVEDQEGRR